MHRSVCLMIPLWRWQGTRTGHAALVLAMLYATVSLVCSARPEDALIRVGDAPLDDSGQPVQAHGGGIVQVDDTFYWCGESYKQPMLGDFISAGINLYSSTDLQSWHFEGLIFNSSQITDIPAHAPYRVERPKILYNAAQGRYVLLFHADTASFDYNVVGVAVSASNITGPYTFVRTFHPDGLNSLDMGVFQESDGRAFLVRSINNSFVGISQLSDSYTDTTGLVSVAPRGEGPAIFKPSDGNYYMMASHLTFWRPNPAMLFHAAADSLATAKWSQLARPAMGPGANTTYNSQSSSVFTLRLASGAALHIYMGDRWNFYGPGSVANSSYVWLPLLPREDGLGYTLLELDEWRPRDYEAQASLPVALNSNATLSSGLSAVERAWVGSLLQPSPSSSSSSSSIGASSSAPSPPASPNIETIIAN
ncbi:hypothetical protein CVIRNUC_003957 [Coccomyxa viridis]|uniref:Glycosyl hydrolase family 43 protein n=1 Tax=Coccomyxa viridis TaxID=1274662 RepID=A0AAV1I1A4_9CHLO|nr:hypothetical protein CVIRNUC_003957 [Coccomyxa viridis]